jgi:type I restriction enzyme, S subunit
MKTKSYPKYKQSGVEWLGEVPEHWEVKQIRHVAMRIQTGNTPPTSEDRYYEDGSLPWYGPSSFNESIYVNDPVKYINQQAVYDGVSRIFEAGTVMIVGIGATIGKISSINIDASCNQQITCVTFNKSIIESKYATYQLKRLEKTIRALAPSATLPIFDQSKIADLWIVQPSLPEQRSITAFLDRETGRIDSLIDKKQRIVKLLKEQRIALISHAVTKGLDPNIKMKQSGVEWLGEVPEHWEVKALKWTTPVLRGASPRPIEDPIYFDEEGEYAWVRISDVTSSKVFLNETTQRLSDIGSNLSVKLNPGALFLSIAATVGVPCIANVKCCIHDGFVYFPRLKSNVKFTYYIFACGEPYKGLGKLGTQLNLNTDTVGSIAMGFPPLLEQKLIADYLDRETGRIDSLIEKVEKAIDILKEHRTALISAAVTGKIDVREAA